MRKSHHTKNTLLQAASSQPTNQSFQESIFSPTQEKLKNKKSPPIQKNKTSFHRTVPTLTDNDFNVNRFVGQVCADFGQTLFHGEKSGDTHNKGLPKAGVTNFYDSFVLNRALVFQMNGSAETPRLRQAPNRYRQC